MQQADLREGHCYGFRFKPRSRDDLVQVELLKKVGRKGYVQIKHLSGAEAGLTEYVKSQQLLVEWRDSKAFVRDEKKFDEVKAVSAQEADHPRMDAVSTVFEALGHPEAAVASAGVLSLSAAALQLLMSRGGLAFDFRELHTLAFKDRHGDVHIPFSGVEKLAQRLAATEPEAVELYIQDLEARYKAEGFVPGDRSSHDFLRMQMPGFAIARLWAGADRLRALTEEIDRLRELVIRSIYDFESLGEKGKAARLRRALEGR